MIFSLINFSVRPRGRLNPDLMLGVGSPVGRPMRDGLDVARVAFSAEQFDLAEPFGCSLVSWRQIHDLVVAIVVRLSRKFERRDRVDNLLGTVPDRI